MDPDRENSSSEEEILENAKKFNYKELLEVTLGDQKNFEEKKANLHLSLQSENRSEGFKIFEKFRQENMFSKSLVNS